MLGIMLVNTGTAAEPTEEAVREHLRVFLSDRHLVDAPPFVWKPILHLFILPHRPRKTLPMYQEFWTEAGSPFTITCNAQRDLVEARLQDLVEEDLLVRFAMRYDPPRIGDTLQELADAGCERIVVVPMYPQWVTSCAGTIFDELDEQYAMRFTNAGKQGPRIIKVREYWEEPGFIAALAASIHRAWQWRPGAKLVMSYHSIPLSYVTKHADTYLETTKATLAAVGQALGITDDDLVLAYQSRFDSRKWAGPFLVPTVEQLAAQGVSDIAVVSPSFSAECIESHFDTNQHTRTAFLEAAAAAGNDHARFTYIPSLGCDEAFIETIAQLIARIARTGA